MERQRIVRNMQVLAERTCRCTRWAIFDQQTEHPESGILRQRIEGDESLLNVHMSSILDIWKYVNSHVSRSFPACSCVPTSYYVYSILKNFVKRHPTLVYLANFMLKRRLAPRVRLRCVGCNFLTWFRGGCYLHFHVMLW